MTNISCFLSSQNLQFLKKKCENRRGTIWEEQGPAGDEDERR
jgi:hypothetical protein